MGLVAWWLMVWWRGVGNGLGFSVDFGNGLGFAGWKQTWWRGGVVVGNGLGLANLGLGLSISA
jgi:hypothetical protein